MPCLAGHIVLPDAGDCPVSPDLLPPCGGRCLLSLAFKPFCKAIVLIRAGDPEFWLLVFSLLYMTPGSMASDPRAQRTPI